VDFTREPIIETVITPREGYRLVVRSSKNVGQEEHFVDAVEVVSFGNAFFYRCLERPKPFMVPLGDYEILEVREPRMALKTPMISAPVKIGQGLKTTKIREQEKEELPLVEGRAPSHHEMRMDRRKDRRRGMRRRPRHEEVAERESVPSEELQKEFEEQADHPHLPKAQEPSTEEGEIAARSFQTSTVLTSVLPPPTTLIRDDLARLRANEAYKGAFYVREEEQRGEKGDDEPMVEEPGGSGTMIEGGAEGDLEVSPEDPFCATEAKSGSSNARENISKTQEDVGSAF